MSLGQGYDIEEVFESAVTIVRNLPKEGAIKPSDDLKLKLYAYFKQATHGPNDTAKPRFYQIVEAYKWEAWRKLADMPKEEAMLNYIRELKDIMDTIPREETDYGDNRQFEDILGKKFYDYWFNQWHQPEAAAAAASPHEKLTTSQSSSSTTTAQMMSLSSSSSSSSTAVAAQQQQQKQGNNNDTQSNSSSGGSSVSMLDDTSQATAAICADADQGGYKTPTSLDQMQASITGQMSDQFALAVLRLQHNLEDTNLRLNRLEEQLRKSIESIRLLETGKQQTFPKQLIDNNNDGNRRKSLNNSNNKWVQQFINSFSTINWFYLSYPILVYFLMRVLFDNRQQQQRRKGGGGDNYSRSLR